MALTAAVVVCLCGACSSSADIDFYNGTGRLYLTLDLPDGTLAEQYAVTLTDNGSGATHTWTSYADFPQGSRFLEGTYTLAVAYTCAAEGFDTPDYRASATFPLADDSPAEIQLSPRPVNVPVVVVTDDSFDTYFPAYTVKVQAAGGLVFDFPPGERRIAWVKPGTLDVFLQLPMPQGDVTLLIAGGIPTTAPVAMPLHLAWEDDASTLTLTAAGRSYTREITEALLTSPAPHVEPLLPELTVTELCTPQQPVAFAISDTYAPRILLSVTSAALAAQGCPEYIDLQTPSAVAREWFATHGLDMPHSSAERIVDLAPLTALIRYLPGGDNTTVYTLTAISDSGLAGSPSQVSVQVHPLMMTIVDVPAVELGADTATVSYKLSEPSAADGLRFLLGDEPLELLDTTVSDTDVYTATLAIPGDDNAHDITATYRGLTLATCTVQRTAPAYTLSVDAYATRAHIRLDEAPEHLRRYIVENLRFRVNDTPATILERNVEEGIITVIGLTPDTRYRLTAGLECLPGDEPLAAPTLQFVTERETMLPNGSFEDALKPVTYDDMPSGGPYSQTIAALIDRQNRTSFSFRTPELWSTTNDKTFCATQATNPNTWYLHPSVMSVDHDAAHGERSVRLVSTAFDPRGPQIRPWVQERPPYTPYSQEIPELRYRAAGKLFLGSYAFFPGAMEEIYDEGIPFTSRPLSLNGAYKYTPVESNLNDHGLARVTIYGRDSDGSSIVIAHAAAELPVAASWTTFNIPLHYTRFGVKATHISVLFASSSDIGDIAYESLNVVTLDDPVTATSLGSTLYLDNITPAY